MVVDDDLDALAIISHHLKAEGFVPLQMHSGSECLRALESSRADLILLDLMMPEMDGFEVCRALKRNPDTAAIPIIMITARDDLTARKQAMDLGIDDYIAKPFGRRALMNRIREQLAGVAATAASEEALQRLAQSRGR
jgi:DNA-binding response OmpR family regulator